MIDSTGRSVLGDMKRSVLGDLSKAVTPTQKHIGSIGLDQPLSAPYAFGSDIILCALCEVTIASVGFAYPVQGFITLSGDLSAVIDAKFRLFFAFSEDAHWVSYEDDLFYVEGYDQNDLRAREFVIHPSDSEYAKHDFPLSLGTAVVYAGAYGAARLHVLNDTVQPQILITAINGTVSATHVYAHASSFSNVRAAYDGTYVYLIGGLGANPLTIAKVDLSAFSVVLAKKISLPAGTQTTFSGPCLCDSGILMLTINRSTNQQPVRLGINTSDLSVAWAKTTRKQTVEVSILVNDAASTYRITISGQTVSVVGNAGGANATASDLQAACAASVLSNFTARTWTVADNVVTGTANNAGITWATTVSVVSGTGTISRVDTQNLYPFSFTTSPIWGGHISSAGRAVIGGDGSGKYGICEVDMLTGEVVAAGRANEAHAGPGIGFEFTSSFDENIYASGRTSRAGTFFGGVNDQDIEVIPFTEVPSNVSFLDDGITMTVVDEPAGNFSVVHTTSGFTAVSDARTAMQSPSETIQTADTDYTF